MGLTKKDATNMADFQEQRNQKYEMDLARERRNQNGGLSNKETKK
jgi:hypothetical protein